MKRRVLITGGTGFVGSWMKAVQPDKITVHYIGKQAYEEMNWKLSNYDYIVHLANVNPGKVLVNNLRAKILYCSSGAAYDQDTEYAKNKRKWEQMCKGMNVVIARPFTFYGRGLDPNKAISQFINNAEHNEPIVIHGTGKAIRSYMDAGLMGTILWTILFDGKVGEIYDVGDTTPITMLQLAEIIRDQHNPNLEIIVENGIDSVPCYIPKNMKKTWALMLEMESRYNR